MTRHSHTAQMPQLRWTDVTVRRMERHGLLAPFEDTPVDDIVAAMGGVHAQVMSAAELSIGMRTVGMTRAAVRNALWRDRTLVKTYGPRGTVHVLPAKDLAAWTGALSAVPNTISVPEDVRLTPDQTDEVIDAIGDALNGVELTIDELSEAVIATTGSWAGDLVMPAFQGMWPRWRRAMATAAHAGVMCFGPNRGRKVTYTNPHTWLPEFSPTDGDAAITELVRRYLYSYGPATPAHFAQWLAAPKGWAARLFESMADELQHVEVDGQRAWVMAGDTTFPATSPETVRLLPYFDAFVVGGQPRDRLFPGEASTRALARGQAGNFPVLLLNGVIGGVWHQRRSGRKIDITVESLDTLTAIQRDALDSQVERLGEILEGVPRLTLGPVHVGPHA